MATRSKSKRKPKSKKPLPRAKVAASPPRAKARRTTAAPQADGPVTLEQAQAMAAARSPQRALRRRAAAMAGPTPATVGDEQQRLRKETRDERERRKREYREVMGIMKRHGARRTPAAGTSGRRRAPGAAAASFRPLQVFAEGDSWFEYPVPLFGGGIVPRLQKRLGVPILNMADAGDEVRFMLGVEQRGRLVECLTEGCPAGGPWDALIFSGGGNDIVDNPMALWIRDWRPGAPAEQLLHQPRFDTALALVRAGYEDLIALRDALSPGTRMLFHAYDFAIPDGRGICNKGPWMKPAFDLRGFPDRASAFGVVKVMLTQFATMLDDLASIHSNITVVKTQGTLAEAPAAWHNELHPQKAGFDTFASKFHDALKRLFPDRVA
jgi:hypothetical protein